MIFFYKIWLVLTHLHLTNESICSVTNIFIQIGVDVPVRCGNFLKYT